MASQRTRSAARCATRSVARFLDRLFLVLLVSASLSLHPALGDTTEVVEPTGRRLTSFQPATSSDSSSCTYTFKGKALSFPRFRNLDPAGDFVLAWSTSGTPPNSTVRVFFRGTPQAPFGWAGWGLSPSGFMAGSDALVGYGSTVNSGQAGAALYHMQGNFPTQVQLAQSANGLLAAVPGTLEVEVVDGGAAVQLLADVAGLQRGLVTVIWRGGPDANVSTGELSGHQDFTPTSAQVDFFGEGEGPPTTSVLNKNQKIAHAVLSAVGFGVLLPLGILVARHLKLWADPLWFHAHVALQLSGYTVGVSGWALGVWLKTRFGDMSAAPEYQQAHFGIGVAIFCSATLQVLSPVLKPEKASPTRIFWNLVHWALGYSTVVMACVNIFLGFTILGGQSLNYGAWRTVYLVFLCCWGSLLLVLEPLTWYIYLKKSREDLKHLPTSQVH